MSWLLTLSALALSAHPNSLSSTLVTVDGTEAHVVMVKLGYHRHPPNRIRRKVVWTRPGKGAVLELGTTPPGRYADLALPTALELQTIAVTDLRSGAARLVRRESQARLMEPSMRSDGDQVALVRLFLDIEALPTRR